MDGVSSGVRYVRQWPWFTGTDDAIVFWLYLLC